MLKFFCISATVYAATAGGCTSAQLASPQAQIQLPGPQFQNGVRVRSYGLYLNPYSGAVMGLEGSATNESGRDLRACILNFDVLNDRGEKVADATAVTSGLKSGMVWRFQAAFLNPFSTTFQRIELRQVIVQ